MRPDLVRRSIVDPQRRRAATHVEAKRLPREGLLKDVLSDIAREKEAISLCSSEGGEEAGFCDAEILRFVKDGVVTANGANFTGGKVRLVLYALALTAPTS
ncbi:MAG TPA: hypothetical protein VKA61_08135 [Sphingomicrobium sp.]|nr:hypothetical protein [Sphingomicrobium sp.]